jgi:hypothetical protein
MLTAMRLRTSHTVLFCAGLLLAPLILPQTALAWNDTGHEIIASLAFDELTPAARAAAIELLKAHPRYEKDLLAGKPEGYDADRYAFMLAATWPDIVRSQDHPMHFVANHPAWHYIDIPFIQPGFIPPPATQPSATQPAATQPAATGPQDIVEALEKVTTDLRNTSVTPADRAIALCWVLHLCGDIHQPLHAVDYFSPQFPQGDKGGNSIMVLRTPNQYYSKINLHALWDTMLGTYRSELLIGYLANGLRNDPDLSRAKLSAALQVRDFRAWAQESHDLAVEHCYLNGTIAVASAETAQGDPHTVIPSLPAGYIEAGETLGARRIVTASYRTAELLNSILGSSGHQ